MYARVAWVLTALTVLIAGADVWVTSAYRPLLSEEAVAVHGFPFVTAAVVGCSAMGALIVARWARHPIGWLLCLIGFFSSISLLTEAYSVWVATADGPGSPGPRRDRGLDLRPAGWLPLIGCARHPLPGCAGRPAAVPPLARPRAIVTLVGYVCYTAGLLTLSPTEYDIDHQDSRADRQSAARPLGCLSSPVVWSPRWCPWFSGCVTAAECSGSNCG